MILITGGMGFVGRNAAKALLDHGEDVVLTTSRVGADPSFLAPHVGKRVFIERLDALDAPNLIETGRRHGVTGIVHLAGGPMHGPLLKGLRDNVHGFLDVLEAGSSLGVKRITVASSIAIYAGVEDQVWREDAPLPMASPYPMTAYKKVFEIYGDYYSRQSKLSLASLRFGAYGPLSRSQYTLPARLVHAAMKGVTGPELRPGEAPPYEDDACDLCYVADLGDAFARVQLAPTLNHSIYNVGTGKSLSNREIADAVRKAVPTAKFELQPGRSDATFPPFDISRLRDDVGWTPRYTIDAGMAEYVSWLKAGNLH